MKFVTGFFAAILFLNASIPCLANPPLQGRLEEFQQTNSSDPGLIIDHPRPVQKLHSDIGRLANTLQNSLFLLSTKHNHFLGQPLVSRIDEDALSLPDAHLYDYYLLSLQFNVPAMKKVPLNKYRYLRFESLLSIAPESLYTGRTEVLNASVMLKHLAEPLGRSITANYGLSQRKQYCLEWLEKLSQDLELLKSARLSSGTAGTDDSIRVQVTELCTLIDEVESDLNDAVASPDVERALNTAADQVNKKLKACLDAFDIAIAKPTGEVATIRESLSTRVARGSKLAELLKKPVNNAWTLDQRKKALTKALSLGANGAGSVCLASNLDPAFRERAATLAGEIEKVIDDLPKTDFSSLSALATSYSQELQKLDRDILFSTEKGGARREAIYGNYKALDKHRTTVPPRNFRVISIYPTNEILKVDFENKQTYEVKVEPKWMEMASGYGRWQSEDTTKYLYELPRVAGIASQYGTVSWTFYPAKRQPVMYGNKNVFAILQVTKGTKGALRVNSCLNYELSMSPPLLGARLYDEASINLDQRMPISSMLRLRAADLGSDGITKIFQSALVADKTQPQLKLSAIANQKPFVEGNSSIYRIDDDQLVKFKMNPSGELEPSVSKFPH
ncbi:MAG: hypothetical protein DKT66_06520 [Candidatus Melainabacteria bacterium]|nr:MAG: hypothetical protein DKT66_06520 [Candidatus Melainabacteria bacterium]